MYLVNVFSWPVAAGQLSITGCQAGKIIKRHERPSPTLSSLSAIAYVGFSALAVCLLEQQFPRLKL